MRPSRLAALAAAAVLGVACAGARPAPPPAAAPEELISADRLRQDVAWLSDPARTGRGVGTPGDVAAADWIAARMQELGLAPGGSEGYLQPFQAPVGAQLKGENALSVGGQTLALSRDWQPFTFSDDASVAGELVWAGYGITAPTLGYDDYAGLDVKGKVVVVAGHFPREADTSSPFRDPRQHHLGEWRYKAMNARDHGAVGLLAVRDDWNHPGPDDISPWRGQVSSRAGIVAARVTLAALAAAGVDAAGAAAPGQADGRPHSRPLGVAARLHVSVEQERARTANVVGLLPGKDASAGCVVVGAHFDHLGYGGETSLAPDRHEVHPGADDNASGVAALLEIARAAVAGGPARRTLVFVAFSGEELGLLGSAHFVRSPPPSCPVDDMQLMLNLDMVGRPREGKLYVLGSDTAVGGRERVRRLAEEPPRIPLQLSFGGDGYGPSDHTSFYGRGVPVVFLFTGAHADYHRPSDTPDKIDSRGLAEVARLAYRVADAAAEARERYAVVKTPPPPGSQARAGERSAGYGAYLGSIPDFEERKEPGVLVSAVRPGSPAEQAGMKGGDVIVRVGATKIVSLQDLVYALRAHRPGDVVEVAWQHAGRLETAQVKLGERK